MPKLNFFTPLLEKEKTTAKYSKGLIVFIVFLLAAGAYLTLQLQIFLLQRNVAENEQQLNNIKTTQLNEILETRKKITDQKNYLKMGKILEQEFKKADFIKVSLLEQIFDTVPQNLFFQDLMLSKSDWQLFGYADTRQIIAEFQYNLKKSEFADKVEISSISNKPVENKGDCYAFSMSGTFNEEVAAHEN